MQDPKCKKAYAKIQNRVGSKMKGGALIDDRRREEAERKQMGAEDERPVVRAPAPAPVRVVSVDEVVKKPRPAPVRRNTVDVVAKPEKKPRPPPVRKNVDPLRVEKLVAQSDLMDMGYRAKQDMIRKQKEKKQQEKRDLAVDWLKDTVQSYNWDQERKRKRQQGKRDIAQDHLEIIAEKAKQKTVLKNAGITDEYVKYYQGVKEMLRRVREKAYEMGLSQNRKKLLDKLENVLVRMKERIPDSLTRKSLFGFYEEEELPWYEFGIDVEEEGEEESEYGTTTLYEYSWEDDANDSLKKLIKRGEGYVDSLKKPRPAPVRKNEPKEQPPTPYAVKTVFKVPWLRKGVLSYMIPNEQQKEDRKDERDFGMPIEFLKPYFRLKDMYKILDDTDVVVGTANFDQLFRKYRGLMSELDTLLEEEYDTDVNTTNMGIYDWNIDVNYPLRDPESDEDPDEDYYDDDGEPELVWTEDSNKILKENIKEAEKLLKKYKVPLV